MNGKDDSFPYPRLGLPAPDTPKAAGECATMDGIRKAIERGSRDSPLISQCLDVARHTGKSGEDTYAFLAYHALVELERAHRWRMDSLSRSIPPVIVPAADLFGDLRKAVEFLDKCNADTTTASETGAFRDAHEWLEKAARKAVGK